ncbi:MAG: hypothetical protein KKI08_11140 [Armatimonadetes bacterium]|nr:hypothetical protein [Armatimonadota bacterium]
MSHRAGTAEGHKGHDAVAQETRLSTTGITYGLVYNSCWDDSHAPGGADGSAYLGMCQPTSANWYQGGFLRLKINGDDLGIVRLADMWVAEQGRRAAVKMHFDHPHANVLISSLLYANDDRLFVVISLSPKAEITSLDLSLLSYPSYFTYWNKRDGDRKGLTAIQTYPQADGKKQLLNPAAQWWTAFYDTIFDPAKGEGDGGCAVAFVPEQVSAAEIVVGSYACTMDLKVKPDTRQIRLCFWDFNKHPNQEALTKLSATLPETLERLRSLSPLPLAITEWDVAAQAVSAHAQLANIAGRQALEQKLTDQTAEMTRLRQELLDNKSPDPAAAEKDLAEKLAAFEQLLWDVKFFVLING